MTTFQLLKNGNDRGDCTAPYKVILDREYTVKEFISEVLLIKGEWGYIGIKSKDNPWLGDPHCEYRYGKLLVNLPDDAMEKKVVSVKADGGWSRMDYLITVEESDTQMDGEAE